MRTRQADVQLALTLCNAMNHVRGPFDSTETHCRLPPPAATTSLFFVRTAPHNRNEVLSDALTRLTTDTDQGGPRMEHKGATSSGDGALQRTDVSSTSLAFQTSGAFEGARSRVTGVDRNGSPVVPRLGMGHDLGASLGGEELLL